MTVRNIEVNTAASLFYDLRRSSPRSLGEDSRISSSYWKCGDVLLRRIGSGMSTQYLQELGRPHIVSGIGSWNIAVIRSSLGITSNGKSEAMRCEESEGVIVPMIAWTTQPRIGKDPYFDRVWNGGKCL